MIKWFRRSAKRRAADAEPGAARLSRRWTRSERQRHNASHHSAHRKGGPPARSGGFDGNQDFITRYGDPFAGLAACGVAVSEVFHPSAPGGQFRPDPGGHVSGRSADSYSSFASFIDPDGNTWLLQEVTTRLPGRIDSIETSFASVSDLADAMRRASVAHGEHEKRVGEADPNWPGWYAAYMVAEQAGTVLPT